ncbi:import inner membrane translocase subunit tim-21 [Ascobolus immersus RN42]|uniref:Mitochondrial import inner membrane translocase subunit Tim21 n=1 Tax=Ascobolus immersus RN42 TaxID=1160509 RepID=A0A3N4J0W0_ASCIM|nr:import inner membrane translocase subunit tim-21 [Ascobolus immersus RN42]
MRLAAPLPRPCVSHIAKLQPNRQPSRCLSSPAKSKLPTTSTGPKQWKDLSGGQKVVRTTQTGASVALIAVGLVLTGGIATLLYKEVFAPDSATVWFNIIVERVKEDKRCLDVLGNTSSIKAYGAPTNSRWARNRPILHRTYTDSNGRENMILQFNVEGDIDSGVINAHLVRNPGESQYDYQYLRLDQKGQSPIYLEDRRNGKGGSGSKSSFLGVNWRW